MNPLLKMIGGGGGNVFAQIAMKAVGAYMRGDTPENFLRSLASAHPELNSLDFNDLEGSARKLAQQKGVDFETVKSEAVGALQQYMK